MNKIIVLIVILLAVLPAAGQNNTNSPYSVFGIGELNFTGGGRNMAMGGSGIALRSDLFLNSTNPASLTAIQPQSFGFDMGLNLKLTYLENKYKSANALNGNISWVQVGFPVLPFLSVGLGLNPKSNVGYSIYSRKSMEGTDSSYPVLYTGEGGLSETSFSLGLKCLKNLSIGASTSLLWGNMNKQTEEYPLIGSISSVIENRDISYSGASFKTGFQFYQDLNSKIDLTVGGTAEFSGRLKTSSDLTISESTGSESETIITETDAIDNMDLPVKFGLGVSLGINKKSTFTFDYNRSDWTNANVNLSSKRLNVNHSFHLGAEISPKNDATHYRQTMKYRAGALYQTGYINLYGIPIDSYAVSLGMSVPIRHDRSSVNFSVEAGRQGTLKQLLVRESYIKLNCSFNLWERWFTKRVYD